jgi:hypothetical protein
MFPDQHNIVNLGYVQAHRTRILLLDNLNKALEYIALNMIY